MSSAVAALPYGKKLGLRPRRLALDEMAWPLGQPDRLKGKLLGDLAPDDHLLIYLGHRTHSPDFWNPSQSLDDGG